ncbi:MAG: glucose-1-phosphate thymidylyltransferase [Ignavibacteria bacterium]
MVYYPLCTLLQAGIGNILLISSPNHLAAYQDLLGDGSRLGINIQYARQQSPRGIAEALIIAHNTVGSTNTVLILGDNIFHGEGLAFRHAAESNTGARIFAYPVQNPRRYGVVELNPDGSVAGIEEKPEHPRSNLAIPGLYIYNSDAALYAKELRPSGRGELEITDVHNVYHQNNTLVAARLDNGVTWLDAGTPESLIEASAFVQTLERRQGIKIACPEVIALQTGLITAADYEQTVALMPQSAYKQYCITLLSNQK